MISSSVTAIAVPWLLRTHQEQCNRRMLSGHAIQPPMSVRLSTSRLQALPSSNALGIGAQTRLLHRDHLSDASVRPTERLHLLERLPHAISPRRRRWDRKWNRVSASPSARRSHNPMVFLPSTRNGSLSVENRTTLLFFVLATMRPQSEINPSTSVTCAPAALHSSRFASGTSFGMKICASIPRCCGIRSQCPPRVPGGGDRELLPIHNASPWKPQGTVRGP